MSSVRSSPTCRANEAHSFSSETDGAAQHRFNKETRKHVTKHVTKPATYLLSNFVQALDKLCNLVYPASAFSVSAQDNRARGQAPVDHRQSALRLGQAANAIWDTMASSQSSRLSAFVSPTELSHDNCHDSKQRMGQLFIVCRPASTNLHMTSALLARSVHQEARSPSNLPPLSTSRLTEALPHRDCAAWCTDCAARHRTYQF